MAGQVCIGISGIATDTSDNGDTVAIDQDMATARAALIVIAKAVLGADTNKIISKLEDAPNTEEGLRDAVNSCKKLVRLLIEKKDDALTAASLSLPRAPLCHTVRLTSALPWILQRVNGHVGRHAYVAKKMPTQLAVCIQLMDQTIRLTPWRPPPVPARR